MEINGAGEPRRGRSGQQRIKERHEVKMREKKKRKKSRRRIR